MANGSRQRTNEVLNCTSLIGLALLAGCAHEEYASSAEKTIVAPESFLAEAVQGAPWTDRWYTDFGSSTLSNLVTEALTNNFDLKVAWARLQQAEAIARQAAAPLWPSLTSSFSASKTDSIGDGETSGFTGGGFIPGEGTNGEAGASGALGFTRAGEEYRLSFGASYELDVWGRLRNNYEAAKLDREAIRADAEALAMTLSAQVATTWFGILAQQQKVDLLEKQLKTSSAFLDLTLMRLGQGNGNGLDVTQQKQQVESIRGQLANARSLLQVRENQLLVLLGRSGPPREGEFNSASARLPLLPPIPDPGLPSDLVRNRPDLRAAMQRLEAADHRTAAAAADRLPKLRLSANFILQEQEIARLLDEALWTAAATASQSLFEGGRRQAAVARTEAVARERLHQYGQTYLNAIREVRDAWIQERQQKELLRSREEQLRSADLVLSLARKRYTEGAVDYLRVLTALQSLQRLQVEHVDERLELLNRRVALYRSLGGTWTRALDPPSDSMAARNSSNGPKE